MVEVLLSAIRTRQLLVGKVIGNAAVGVLPWSEVAIALGISLVFAVVSIRLADRACRASVLQPGPRLAIANVFRGVRHALTGSRRAATDRPPSRAVLLTAAVTDGARRLGPPP